ncbi:MAG: response regulator [Pseudomonadota bacterium]
MYRIMLVDDEENILNALRRLLAARPLHEAGEQKKYTVEIFSAPAKALRRAEDTAFDLVVSDYRMPEMDGVVFLKAFRQLQSEAVRIILSGYADLDGLIGAINEAQIYRFIAKPWNDFELKAAVAQALDYRRLQLENQRLADEVRAQRGIITRQEFELRRLEQESPGITRVNWGPDGSVIMDEDLETGAAPTKTWLNTTK